MPGAAGMSCPGRARFRHAVAALRHHPTGDARPGAGAMALSHLPAAILALGHPRGPTSAGPVGPSLARAKRAIQGPTCSLRTQPTTSELPVVPNLGSAPSKALATHQGTRPTN